MGRGRRTKPKQAYFYMKPCIEWLSFLLGLKKSTKLMAYVWLLNEIASINLELAFLTSVYDFPSNHCIWKWVNGVNERHVNCGRKCFFKFFSWIRTLANYFLIWRKNELCGDWAYYEMLVVVEADQLYMRIGLEGFWPSREGLPKNLELLRWCPCSHWTVVV